MPSHLAGHGHHHRRVHIVIHKAHGGDAVQNGSQLTVTVFAPAGNHLSVSDLPDPVGLGSALRVSWNGGISHLFRGVTDVTLNVQAGTNNSVTYDFTGNLVSGDNVRNITANLRGGNDSFTLFGPQGVNTGPAVTGPGGDFNVRVDTSQSTGNGNVEINVDGVSAGAQATLVAIGGPGNNTISESALGTLAGTTQLLETGGRGNNVLRANLSGSTIQALVKVIQEDDGNGGQIFNTFTGQVLSGGSLQIVDNGGFTGNTALTSDLTFTAPSPGSVDDTLNGRSPGANTFTLNTHDAVLGPLDNLTIQGSTSSSQNTANFSAGVKVFNCQVQNQLP